MQALGLYRQLHSRPPCLFFLAIEAMLHLPSSHLNTLPICGDARIAYAYKTAGSSGAAPKKTVSVEPLASRQPGSSMTPQTCIAASSWQFPNSADHICRAYQQTMSHASFTKKPIKEGMPTAAAKAELYLAAAKAVLYLRNGCAEEDCVG